LEFAKVLLIRLNLYNRWQEHNWVNYQISLKITILKIAKK